MSSQIETTKASSHAVDRRWRRLRVSALLGVIIFLVGLAVSPTASAAPNTPSAPSSPAAPSQSVPNPTTGGGAAQGEDGSSATSVPVDEEGRINIEVDLGDLTDTIDPNAKSEDGTPSQSVTILIFLTLLSLLPSLLVVMTSFTRMVVVLSIARNAVGLQTIPPNQVITGLALFLSLFVMAPTIKQMNDNAFQPYMNGEIEQSQAFKEAEKPLKEFMLANTRTSELDLMVSATDEEAPEEITDLSMMTVIPAFILSELKSAFIIGVMILLPFLIIDLVVGAGLMSLGMMMLPPVFVSLPFKLLLFVMADGWALIAHSLLANYH